MGVDFSPEQKRWIEGFTSGAAAVRGAVRSVPVAASPAAPAEPTGPDASLVRAQDRAASAGKKLVDQEKWKRAEHPMDAYARLKSQALAGAKPKPEDNFRWRYHGLFYVAPAQDSYMCRMRVPNGILTHAQLSAIADLAERYGGGYADVTTRANLQVREILPQNGPATVEALAEAGILVKGAGADNIRNVTGSATAGIDPHELIDTRPHARAWHHHVLNNRVTLRPAAQVQRRFRRGRVDRNVGRHERHRFSGGRGRPWGTRRTRRLVSADPRRHHRTQGFRPRHRNDCQTRRRHQRR